jgi:uncharacterized protein (UPF0548 family)
VVVKLLDASEVARLRGQELTYPAVPRPVAAAPAGYGYFSKARLLPDAVDFAAAASALFSWQVQARSGLQILTSSLRVELDAVIVMRLGVGSFGLSIPCRVVDVINEPGRYGFSYGSLPGHPESGEESFLLQRDDSGRASFSVAAFSRPATRLAKLGGPVTPRVQRFVTGRYLRALG